MIELSNKLYAGWAKSEIVPPARYPLAGYLARKNASRGSLDPLFVRALTLQQGKVRVCLVVADLLLISDASAVRLQKQIGRATGISPRNVIVAATHTHSGPLVDTRPFHLSHSDIGGRVLEFTRELENIFVRTAVSAHERLQAVRISYSLTPIHELATDRNQPKKDRVQTFTLIQLQANGSSAVWGVLPCHPTVLGAANLRYSGDLHGEIARRYERQFDVALIANGACANISTRFTRRSQTQTQVSRSAASVVHQAEATPLRACASGTISIATLTVRLPVKSFRHHENNEDTALAGRLADVAREGKRVAAQLSKTPEFNLRNRSVGVTFLRFGPVSFAAFPFELYAETGRFLWINAKTVALCYANGYWGYVYGPGASAEDYEVISSPFTARADRLLREAVLRLARKT